MNNKIVKGKAKVLFYYAYGENFTGAPRVIANLLRRLDVEKIHPVFLTQFENELSQTLASEGFEVYILPLPPGLKSKNGSLLKKSPWKHFSHIRSLLNYNSEVRKIAEKHSISCIWARNIKSVLLTCLAARWLKIPFIWDIGLERESFWARPIHWFALMNTSYVVNEAGCQYKKIFGALPTFLFRKRLKTIYSGIEKPAVDVSGSFNSAQVSEKFGQLSILNVGTIHPRKNQLMLLRALKKADEIDLNCKITFSGSIGDEQYYKDCQDFVARHKLYEKVSFLGWCNNIPELMRNHDLLALVSKNEGVPCVIREAMSVKMPVISTCVGGVPEIITDGENGFLVEKDNVSDLVNTLVEYASSEDLDIQRIVDSAYETINSKFSIDKWAKEYNSLLFSAAS